MLGGPVSIALSHAGFGTLRACEQQLPWQIGSHSAVVSVEFDWTVVYMPIAVDGSVALHIVWL